MRSFTMKGLAALMFAAAVFLAAPSDRASAFAGASSQAAQLAHLAAKQIVERGSPVVEVRRGRNARGFRKFKRRGIRRHRRARVRSFHRRRIRRARRYRFRPRIYIAPPAIYYRSYSYRRSYSRQCYRPCRWSGYSKRYCRNYCRRHYHW